MIFAFDDLHIYSSLSAVTEQSATTAITEFDVDMDPEFLGDVSMSSVGFRLRHPSFRTILTIPRHRPIAYTIYSNLALPQTISRA